MRCIAERLRDGAWSFNRNGMIVADDGKEAEGEYAEVELYHWDLPAG